MSKQFAWSTQVSAPPFELPTRVGSFAVLKSFLGSANTHAPPGMGALGGLGGEGGDGGAPGGEGGCPGRVGGEGGLTGGRGGLGAGLGGLGGGAGGLGAGLGGLGGGRGLGGMGGLGGWMAHLNSGVPGRGTVMRHRLRGRKGKNKARLKLTQSSHNMLSPSIRLFQNNTPSMTGVLQCSPLVVLVTNAAAGNARFLRRVGPRRLAAGRQAA